VSGVDLLTAGEAFEDLIFFDLPRLPRPGEEIKTSRFMRTVGGGAVITAIAAARLGVRCRVVSGLSPAASALLTRERVQFADVRRRSELPAISAALSTPRNRSFVTYNGVNDWLEPRLMRPIRGTDARHVHFAFFPARCARWLPVIAALGRRGVSTSWDFGWNEGLLDDREFYRLVASLDYVLLNEQEAILYARTRTLRRAFAFWKSQARVSVIKRGRRGSRWIARELEIEEAAPIVRPVDTTGAGDAFNGGFLAARLRGQPPRQSLRAGNRVGALSTRAAGGIDALPRAIR
jgi:sugar/nucleoside kinase (ribokinase family)